MSKPLTDKQIAALKFFYDYSQEHHRPPALRELGKHVGWGESTNGIRYKLDALIKDGYLVREPLKARGTTMTDKGLEAIGFPVKVRVVKIIDPKRLEDDRYY